MTTALVIAAVLILIAGLFAVIVERTGERDEARANADRWAAQAETFADELNAADQQRIVSDGIIARLRGDVLDAQMRLADALNEAAEAPAPVIPLVPRQRDGSEYEWPDIAREIQTDDLAALMRATEEN